MRYRDKNDDSRYYAKWGGKRARISYKITWSDVKLLEDTAEPWQLDYGYFGSIRGTKHVYPKPEQGPRPHATRIIVCRRCRHMGSIAWPPKKDNPLLVCKCGWRMHLRDYYKPFEAKGGLAAWSRRRRAR